MMFIQWEESTCSRCVREKKNIAETNHPSLFFFLQQSELFFHKTGCRFFFIRQARAQLLQMFREKIVSESRFFHHEKFI